MRPTNTLLILALCAGMLATGAASGQGETPLDVCGDDDRELAARADACWTAAEQGLAQAQHNLGLMYSKGHGVPQDYAKAVEWYRRAAEQGNATAQNNLGVMYDNGQGVPQDHAKAVEWYPTRNSTSAPCMS